MTTAADPQIVPYQPASLPALRAADHGVASALEAVLSANTKRVYATQWKLFDKWCGEMGLRCEGVRAVGVPDRPAGEGDRQGRGVSRLGVLQRPQRGVAMARRMAQNGAPTHEIERQGRWKQGGGMVGRYTRGETAVSALRYL